MASTPAASSRSAYLDSAKGLLIFLVAWGHLIQSHGYHQSDRSFYDDRVFQAIYMFHMPLFIAISGYLSYHSIAQLGLWEIVKRRFLQLIVPAFFWGVIYGACLAGKALLGDGAGLHDAAVQFLLTVLKSAASLWFLWAVFLFTVITAFLKRFRLDTAIPAILICLAYTAMTGVGKDYLFKFTLPFFFIGYQVARLGVLPWLKKNGAAVLSAAASAAFFFLWERDDYVYVTHMALGAHGIQVIVFRLLCGICLSVVFLKGLSVVYDAAVFKPFVWLGKRTLEIYILHSLLLKVIPVFPNLFPSPAMFSVFEAPILAFLICLLCGIVPSVRFARPKVVPSPRPEVLAGS